MKKTQIIGIFADIRSTFVSFFSILMFVALGVSVFLGLRWGAFALGNEFDSRLEAENFHDIEILLPHGITDDLEKKILAVDGVHDAEGVYVSYEECKMPSGTQTIMVRSLTERIDVPTVLEGRLPNKEGEIAVLEVWARNNDVEVGDKITIAQNDPKDIANTLDTNTLTVTGLVEYGGCLARNTQTYGLSPMGSGTISCVAFVDATTFNILRFLGASPVILVTCDGVDGLSTFSDEYRDEVDGVADRLLELGSTVVPPRIAEVDELVDNGQALLAELSSEDNKAEIDAARQSVKHTKNQIDSLELKNWIVTTRASNGGVMMARMFVDILGRLCFSMASLFVIVGLLVCYSAISRIVHEQVVLIGTKKALGLFKWEITASYLAYAACAVILGIAIGSAAAIIIVQRILNVAISSPFIMGVVRPYGSLVDACAAGGVELALILLVTWISCHGVLRRRAKELLAGVAPPATTQRFYERWGLWKRLPLLTQTVVNNCVADKRRVFGTVVGVAGCTALVVCALTLNNNVLNSFSEHYKDVYGFDTVAKMNVKTNDGAKKVTKQVRDAGYVCAPVVRRTLGAIEADSSITPLTLTVPQANEMDAFNSLYLLHGTQGEVDLSKDGVWLSAGYGKIGNVKPGDTITVVDSSNVSRTATVLGYYDFYLMNVDMVMGQKAYEKLFGIKYVPNALLIDSQGTRAEAVGKKLKKVSAITSVIDDYDRAMGVFGQFRKISKTVVLVYVGLAALMAIVVLYNLDVMYIMEKRRELIVLMICGFSARQTKRYVRNDTIVLTIVGILVGVVLGTVVGLYSVSAVEPTYVRFLHEVNLASCGIGAGVCAAFATVVGFFALRRIPRFELTEINRF